MKKTIILLCAVFIFVGCEKKEKVVIYSSMEDYRIEAMRGLLEKDLPEIDIEIQYFPSGNNLAKLKAEKLNTKADIIMDLDYASYNIVSDYLEDLSSYDYTIYEEDVVPNTKKYMPSLRSGLGIVVGMDRLEKLNLEEPKNFADLLKEDYKDEIIMPNPKASGTGYGFYLAIMNLLGEEEGLKYFDDFSKNINQFTSSGSGPINAVVRGEATIALGMLSQASYEIGKNSNIKVIEFEEGNPFSLVGQAVVKDRLQREEVKAVFDYLISTWTEYDLSNFLPEKLLKSQKPSNVENYPIISKYMNMTGFDSAEKKEYLLSLWTH